MPAHLVHARVAMPIATLRDLYVDELAALLDAESQIVDALQEMAASATSGDLRDALMEHHEQTRVHVERVELLRRKLGVSGAPPPCEAVRGLVAEARRRIADTERGEVLDAALIAAAQRVEHYEIAAYASARAYARTLGDGEAERLLHQTLHEETHAEARLSRIASDGVTQAAGADETLDPARQRERLRYVSAAALRDFKYREFRVRDMADEDLGSLDGLIVDAQTGRPAYFVIDSGGWFVGQRYLIPVDHLQPDEGSATLRTTLDRDAVRAYPPFNPDAFTARPDAPRAAETAPRWLMPGVWMTDTTGFASVPPRAASDLVPPPESYPENELMMARGEPDSRAEENVMANERMRNEDARGGDVVVQDSIASGKPQLPTDQDPTGRETNVAIDADELGENRGKDPDGR